MIQPGTTLAQRFEVAEELGCGGLAIVYAAHDSVLDTSVALKVLLPHLAGQPVVRERFRREVAMSRRLDHPGIVRVFDLFEADGYLFFSMEHCAGTTLKDHIRIHGPPAADARIELIRQLGAALSAAHRQGVVHRDIKPQNVMREPDGRVRLLDFGLARVESMVGLTSHSVMLGTPDYMAPEAMMGLPVDGRADLYSLGVLWYELATGRMPLSAASPIELIRKISEEDGPAPTGGDVSSLEAGWVAQLLRRHPDERFASVDELLANLDAGSEARPVMVGGERVCPRCGAEQPEGPEFCLACGADASEAAAAGGNALLVLMRADCTEDTLVSSMQRFRASSNPVEDAARAISHQPAVLLRGVDTDFARAIQQQVVQDGMTTEVRSIDENNFDLLHRTGTPGLFFVGGLLFAWAALCFAAWKFGGTVGLCVGLVVGPPMGWQFQRRAHRFLPTYFRVLTTAMSGTEHALATAFRAYLATQPSAGLQAIARRLMIRTHLLIDAVESMELSESVAAVFSSMAVDTAGAGLDRLCALQALENSLRASDVRVLWEEIERAELDVRRATDADAVGRAEETAEERRAALRRHSESEHQRARGVQGVLQLCAELDRARRTLVDAQTAEAEGQQASLADVRAQLNQEVEQLAKAVREVDGSLEVGA